MTILESHLAGKKTIETCEDGIVTTSHHVAVIDGSTSKTERKIHPDVSNGKWAMMRIKEFITLLPDDISLKLFCQQVTEHIATSWKKETGSETSLTDLPPKERPTASVIIYSPYYQEVWMIGDCQCLVDGVFHDNNKPAEAMNAERRSLFAEQLLANGITVEQLQRHDVARNHIIPDIITSMNGQNKSYAVIDGTPVYTAGIRVIDTKDSHEIVLASDGYPFLLPTLEESEQQLHHLLRHDPLCIHLFKATKGAMAGNMSFDDRAYVRLKT